jgi:large subunit ribosomal protein L23
MALFNSKKNKDTVVKDASVKKEKKVAAVVAKSDSPASPIIHRGQHYDIIIRPRITEKSGIMSENSNIYTFEVRKNANKPMIAQAIKALYKVTPMKVRIVNLPAKRVLVRGKRGTSNAVKKAMVYLKKGEKINLT